MTRICLNCRAEVGPPAKWCPLCKGKLVPRNDPRLKKAVRWKPKKGA